MLEVALFLVGVQLPADTVTLSVSEAFDRALERSPEVVAARARSDAAADRALQAAALPNPFLSFTAENLGRESEITGLDRWDGVEGQLFVTGSLPFGPTRSGTIGLARAEAVARMAGSSVVEQEAAAMLVDAFAGFLGDQAAVDHAREEFGALDELATMLLAQAEEGRAAEADAARARLERGLAATRLARRRGELATSRAEVVRRLELDPEALVRFEVPACRAPSSIPGPAPILDDAHPLLLRARARADGARWSIEQARGIAAPDLQPQIGIRRGGGYSALYLGLSAELPFFDRGRRAVAAASSEAAAAEVELALVEARLAAEMVAARRTVEALEEAGRTFDAGWFAALERSVEAAEARWELGEGTLFELLDARRTRLRALDDYATWQAEWWGARAALLRTMGRTPGSDLLCTDPFRENRP